MLIASLLSIRRKSYHLLLPHFSFPSISLQRGFSSSTIYRISYHSFIFHNAQPQLSPRKCSYIRCYHLNLPHSKYTTTITNHQDKSQAVPTKWGVMHSSPHFAAIYTTNSTQHSQPPLPPAPIPITKQQQHLIAKHLFYQYIAIYYFNSRTSHTAASYHYSIRPHLHRFSLIHAAHELCHHNHKLAQTLLTVS